MQQQNNFVAVTIAEKLCTAAAIAENPFFYISNFFLFSSHSKKREKKTINNYLFFAADKPFHRKHVER